MKSRLSSKFIFGSKRSAALFNSVSALFDVVVSVPVVSPAFAMVGLDLVGVGLALAFFALFTLALSVLTAPTLAVPVTSSFVADKPAFGCWALWNFCSVD